VSKKIFFSTFPLLILFLFIYIMPIGDFASANTGAIDSVELKNTVHNEVASIINAKFDSFGKYINIISFVVAVITLVTGVLAILLAFNVFHGREELNKINKELIEITSLKKKFTDDTTIIIDAHVEKFKETLRNLEGDATNLVKESIKREVKKEFIFRDQYKIIDALTTEQFVIKDIYRWLSDIITFPDEKTNFILNLCEEKLSKDSDIMKLVTKGRAKIQQM
jgi:hypothetical protein